jgi:two-component system chemotaxis sensor kinase CheA
VAVVEADARRFGLVVDRVLSTEEIVVKPLSPRFQELGAYAGATILGDGRVALILDVQGLARRARLNIGTGERSLSADTAAPQAAVDTGRRQLVVAIGERRVAIPLEMVTRLETFPAERLERAGEREVVQYRGQILPLTRLANLLGAATTSTPGDAVLVVVYTEKERSAGLVVDGILDIVDGTAAESEHGGYGLTGSAVVQQRVTELLDVRNAILATDPNFYSDPGQELVLDGAR